jgi:hypothetical protein
MIHLRNVGELGRMNDVKCMYAKFNHIIETWTRGKTREIRLWTSQRDSVRLSRTGRAYSLKP